jgi:nucleoside-diphosphate-sugar epimerase
MRVLITGGTGFIGSHTVAAVVRAGHDVRLLVRRPERVGPALAPFGLHAVDVVTGDVLDAGSVQGAADGCDAVIHAAALYSMDPREGRQALTTNRRATKIVLQAAVQARLDPIVYVSSYVAMLPSRNLLSPDSPIGVGGPPYPRSKAESEVIARRHQTNGVPLVVTYPGAVIGPHDPYFGDSAFTIAMILRNRIPFEVPGGWPVADVRYIADAHAAALRPGMGPRRYLLGGHYRTWRELYDSLRRLTGRHLPAAPTPRSLALASGTAMDGLQRLVRQRLPFGQQASWIVTYCPGIDNAAARTAREELGVEPPPLEETLGDTIRWMVEAGHLSAKIAGRLAQADRHTGPKG